MSRGFVKEDDQQEIPMVPPRADLPEGVENYVTRAGMNALLDEKQMLIDERSKLGNPNEDETRIAINHINAKLHLLNQRIASAKIVKLKGKFPEEIKFGAKVTLKAEANNKIQTLQIVGVDEADFSRGKISFTSPLAKALINKKVGEKALLHRAKDKLAFEILKITY